MPYRNFNAAPESLLGEHSHRRIHRRYAAVARIPDQLL